MHIIPPVLFLYTGEGVASWQKDLHDLVATQQEVNPRQSREWLQGFPREKI